MSELFIRQAVEEINSEIPKIQELFDIAYEYNRKDTTRTELSQKCTTYLIDVWQTLGAIVDNYLPAKNNEDTISRVAYEQIKWERDTAIQQLKDLGYGFCEKPKDNKGDLISRQAVLKGIAEWVAYGYADSEADISYISNLVTHLPSVENKGEWIESKERSKHWYCSVCGGIHTDLETGKWRETFDYRYPFCPNCGAKMKGGE